MDGRSNASAAKFGEGLWPGPVQLNLIKAALWTGDDAVRAWHAWQTEVDLEGAIDRLTFRLLPLLYLNMHAHGQTGREMPRLKGLYRNTWYLNNRLFNNVRPLLRALDEAGFRLLFLKGVPLAQAYYPKLGTRPINDVDILAPLDQAEALLPWMFDRGYTRQAPDPRARIAQFRSQSYRFQGEGIDLHWHLLRDCADPELSTLAWHEADAFVHDGLDAWTLSPTEMLFHQVLHGLRWNEESLWIPDAWTVIRQRGEELDWPRLVALCKRFGSCERCYLGLRFLRDELRAEIPEAVLESLSRGDGTLAER